MLSDFILEKPQKEPLHQFWKEMWQSVRDRANRYAPSDIIKRIEAAIATIELIDPKVYEIRIEKNQRATILLGAGASAPPPSRIPIVGNLLPELWRRAKKIGRDELDRLAEWCDNRSIRNIEDLLTAAYVANFAAKNSSITSLLDYFLFSRARNEEEEEFYARRGIRPRSGPDVDASSIALLQDTLQTLFGLLTSTMIPADPNEAHYAITKFLSSRPNTRIVTTNYDGCMDEALLKDGRSLTDIAGTGLRAAETDKIELIKMHGSINWSYCDSCQDVRDFSLIDLKSAYQNDSLSYAVIGICKTCGGQRRPLLVPPLSFKFMMFPNLVSLWNSARLG